MTLGEKIKKLRREKDLTQKELADELNVAFQTVSKWENDENEPDIQTLKSLSKFFGCSVNYLISDEEVEEEKKEKETEKPVQTTVIIHQNDLHVCAKCGKDIPEDELASEDVTKQERHGRYTRTTTVGQTFYHKKCLAQVKNERINQANIKKKAAGNRAKKLTLIWSIVLGVVGFVVPMVLMLIYAGELHPAGSVFLGLLMGYGVFAAFYCILSGSYIGEIMAACAGFTVKFPGLIFEWDVDGIIWAITMKLAFIVLAFLIGVGAFLFGLALSSFLALFTFPFCVIHNHKTDYEDSFFVVDWNSR